MVTAARVLPSLFARGQRGRHARGGGACNRSSACRVRRRAGELRMPLPSFPHPALFPADAPPNLTAPCPRQTPLRSRCHVLPSRHAERAGHAERTCHTRHALPQLPQFATLVMLVAFAALRTLPAPLAIFGRWSSPSCTRLSKCQSSGVSRDSATSCSYSTSRLTRPPLDSVSPPRAAS